MVVRIPWTFNSTISFSRTLRPKFSHMKYTAELTDLFYGEANYGWVYRARFTLPDSASDLAIVRRAKAELGLSGARCRRADLGETIELRPYGSLTVAFIFPCY